MPRVRTVVEEKKRKLEEKKRNNAAAAAWVKDARLRLGFRSQQKFAEALGLKESGRGMVAKWETAVEAPGHVNTRKIEALLRGLPSADRHPMLPSFPDDGRTDVDFDRMVLEDLRVLPPARRLKLLNQIHEEAEQLRSSQGPPAPEKG